jgi:hypothetical protein
MTAITGTLLSPLVAIYRALVAAASLVDNTKMRRDGRRVGGLART